MIISHNMSALNTCRQNGLAVMDFSKSTEKLASGCKVNRAADDAAGLAISEKMRKQIRGLSQASENCEDGISMVQIAEGALAEVHDMLHRMNELCIQAANGTNATSDRRNIQDEIDQLRTEIDRVAETTKFNETYLLDGSIGQEGNNTRFLKKQAKRINEVVADLNDWKSTNKLVALNGENAGRSFSADELATMDGIKIVYLQHDVVTTQTPVPAPGGAPTNTDPQYNNLKNMLKTELVPNAVDELVKAYGPAFDFLKGSSIGIGLKLTTSADPQMGASTLAFVQVGWSEYMDGQHTVVPDGLNYQLAVNLDHVHLDASGNMTSAERNKLEVTIVHEMMHAFMDEAVTNGMVGVVDGKASSGDEFPLWFSEGMAQSAAGGYYDGNDWVNGSLGINTSSTESAIKTALATNKIGSDTVASNYGTGYLACMYLGYLAGGKSMSATAIKSGLAEILTDIRDGVSLENKVKELTGYTTLADFQDNFANDGATFVKELTAFVGSGAGGAVGNFTKNDDILSDSNANQGVKLFELDIVNDNIHNKYPAGYTVFAGGSTTNGKEAPVRDRNKVGSIAIDYVEKAGLGASLHIGAESDMNNKLYIFIDAVDSKSIGVDKVDATTVELATISIERVSMAIARVSEQRSRLGSYQNRLEHTVKNLDNVVENTTASESLIRDTNMEKEVVKHSRVSILNQAAQSMLVQANQANQGVLQLIA